MWMWDVGEERCGRLARRSTINETGPPHRFRRVSMGAEQCAVVIFLKLKLWSK